MTRFRLCNDCEFGSDGMEAGICRKAYTVYVGAKTVQDAQLRLSWQNYLVGLNMSSEALIDWMIDKIRDFKGYYHNEDGIVVAVPGYACLLRDGTMFWFRDQLEKGRWASVADVPRLRSEAVARWRLIATVIGIAETVQPICPRR